MATYSEYKSRGGTSDNGEDAVLNGGLWDAFEGIMQNHVVSGFDPSFASLNLTITAGTLYVAGRQLITEKSTVIAVADSATSYIYVDRSGTFSQNTTGTAPTDGFLLCTVVASGGAITSATKTTQISPFQSNQLTINSVTTDKIVNSAISTNKIADGAVTASKMPQISGITSGEYTHPTVTVNNRGLITGISSGSMTLNDLTDVNSVNAGNKSVIAYDSKAGKFVATPIGNLVDVSSPYKVVSRTYTYLDFAVGGASTNYTISDAFILKGNIVGLMLKVKHNVTFAAPDASAAVIEVLYDSTQLNSAGDTNVFDAVSATNYDLDMDLSNASFSHTENNAIDVKLTLTGDNVNDMTAGEVTITLAYLQL